MSKHDRAPEGEDRRERLERVLRLYRTGAAAHDRHAAAADPIRRRAIADLQLSPGDTVLDAGCGSGLSFELLQEAVGPQGRVVGIDPSPEMLARARERLERAGWENVDLVEGAVAEAADPELEADAVLLCLVHDVMRSPADLDAMLAAVRPGGRVIAAGVRWADWWAPGMNSYLLFLAAQYTTTFEGLDRPWTLLEERVPGLAVDTVAFASAYLASGARR